MLAPGQAFDARPDLSALLRLIDVAPSAAVTGAVQTLHRVWRNNFRYMGFHQQARVLRAGHVGPSVQSERLVGDAADRARQATRILQEWARKTKWTSRNT